MPWLPRVGATRTPGEGQVADGSQPKRTSRYAPAMRWWFLILVFADRGGAGSGIEPSLAFSIIPAKVLLARSSGPLGIGNDRHRTVAPRAIMELL